MNIGLLYQSSFGPAIALYKPLPIITQKMMKKAVAARVLKL